MADSLQKVVELRRGPKTRAGKAKVSQNAIRHGLLVSTPVLASENADEYDQHVTSTIESLGANSHVEVLLATRIAQVFWRLARLNRYETGQIDKGQQSTCIGFGRQAENASAQVSTLQSAIDMLEGDTSRASLNPSAVDLVFEKLAELGCEGAEETCANLEMAPITPESFQRAVLEVADDDLVEQAIALLRVRLIVERLEERDAAAKLRQLEAASLMPPDQALDKITRYESHLQRTLSKTLEELRVLQRDD